MIFDGTKNDIQTNEPISLNKTRRSDTYVVFENTFYDLVD